MALRIFAFVALLLIGALPAQADWHEASSDHFVIYADQKAEQVNRFAERLERYHAAIQFLLKRESVRPSPSNRVAVYVVANDEQVRKLFGGDNRFVAGFYVPRAGSTIAIVPRINAGAEQYELSGETVLLHEYAHHVMYGDSAYSYPMWYSEGFAEFLASASFEKEGGVSLGRPAMHRGAELFLSKNVPIERLLDTKAYLASSGKGRVHDEFYGRSWLLFHYLTLEKKRPGQMDTYLKAIRNKTPELEAAKTAFGDLKLLDKELESYLKQRKMFSISLKPAALKTGAINVRKMDDAEAAVMPLVIRSRRGVDEERAKKLLPEVQAVAAKFPTSAPVLAALAEAEFDAGNDDAAIAAAEKASAVDPKNINAMIQKGYALARKAEEATDNKKAWAAVRKQFVRVNEIENDHPIPLIHFYQSYVFAGSKPTDNAVDGLVWALQLAPFDKGLRMNVGNALIEKERFDDAIIVLQPIANDVHNEELGQAAQKMIDVAKAKKTAITADAQTVAAPPAKEAPAKAAPKN